MNAEIKCLHTEVWPLEKFVEHPKNPNRHPPAQVELLAGIIKSRGWRSPIVVSRRSGLITKGHGRLAAARHAGLTEAPMEYQDYESEAHEIADLVADNRIPELSEIDQFALHGVLEELKADESFDLRDTGFTDKDFDAIAAEATAGEDLSDGIIGSRGSGKQLPSDTSFRVGGIKFTVPRADYLKWQNELRQSVGFSKRSAIDEIKRRLGMNQA